MNKSDSTPHSCRGHRNREKVYTRKTNREGEGEGEGEGG